MSIIKASDIKNKYNLIVVERHDYFDGVLAKKYILVKYNVFINVYVNKNRINELSSIAIEFNDFNIVEYNINEDLINFIKDNENNFNKIYIRLKEEFELAKHTENAIEIKYNNKIIDKKFDKTKYSLEDLMKEPESVDNFKKIQFYTSIRQLSDTKAFYDYLYTYTEINAHKMKELFFMNKNNFNLYAKIVFNDNCVFEIEVDRKNYEIYDKYKTLIKKIYMKIEDIIKCSTSSYFDNLVLDKPYNNINQNVMIGKTNITNNKEDNIKKVKQIVSNDVEDENIKYEIIKIKDFGKKEEMEIHSVDKETAMTFAEFGLLISNDIKDKYLSDEKHNYYSTIILISDKKNLIIRNIDYDYYKVIFEYFDSYKLVYVVESASERINYQKKRRHI